MTQDVSGVKEFLEKMQALAASELHDTELDHEDADALLCGLLLALGYKNVVDWYNKIPKWYA